MLLRRSSWRFVGKTGLVTKGGGGGRSEKDVEGWGTGLNDAKVKPRRAAGALSTKMNEKRRITKMTKDRDGWVGGGDL